MLQNVDHDRLETAHETLYGDHHQNQSHQAHHDVIARLAHVTVQTCGSAEDQVGDKIDQSDRPDQDAFLCQCHGIVHQHQGIGDRTRPAEHRDGKGRNGNVVHICLHLLLFQLGFRIACLQHVETDREDDNAPRNTEPVCRNTEKLEQELPGESENHQRQERYDCSAADNGTTLFLTHAIRHGQKDRHRP